MARCHDILCDEVGLYRGTMTRTSGGTAKAVFGAPFAHEDHAQRACDAALSISARFANYSKKLREEEEVELWTRIGLVSGGVLSGSLSSEAEISSEDLEDVEDLIPKVRRAIKPGTVVVARSTHKLVREFTELEKCREPVKSEDVEVCELLRPAPFFGLQKYSPQPQKHPINAFFHLVNLSG